MKRDTLLKIQFITGITLAYLVIVGSFLFYLQKQNHFNKNEIANANSFTERRNQIKKIESNLLKINHYKFDRLVHRKNENELSQNEYKLHSERLLAEIFEPNSLFDTIPEDIKNLSPLITEVSILNTLDEYFAQKSLQENVLTLEIEQQNIHNSIDAAIVSLSKIRQQKTDDGHAKLNETLRVIIPCGIIALLAILFVLYKISQIIENLGNYARKERMTNKEFVIANKKIEDNNWVLQSSNKVYENISGLDGEIELSENALKTISESLEGFYAGAIYVREPQSDIFSLRSTKGFLKSELSVEFVNGEGILGEVTLHKEHKIFHPGIYNEITINTTLIEHIPSRVILFPLVHDQISYGLLELAGRFDKRSMSKTLDFLSRAARTIAGAIKFGQNHLLVEDLLEKTQKQTEELEAQQEELRITNEELIYKTSLLESSEEELRVQQEELSQANIELNEKAEELQKRNIELSEAQQIVEQKIVEVEQASKYKSEFIANMSHELRTPLNSILILAKLLKDNKIQNLSDEQVKYATVIHSAGSDLLELINEILDLAKIEAGKVEINEENIVTEHFSRNIENLFKEIATQKGIKFVIHLNNPPTSFVSDEYRLEQVLKNFLSNAFKFTEKNGTVEIEISEYQDEMYFSVSDTGKGITQEKQELIFEAFRQEDGSTSRKFGGTGLGLSISKEIAVMLNGRIVLESESGKGSKFSLIIPYISSNLNRPKKTIEAKYPSTIDLKNDEQKTPTPKPVLKEGKTILIIEDDINFADILKDFAKNYGFNVVLAHDGEQGISLAIQHRPDAIILDVMLPISDGWEVLRTLKKDSNTNHIPVHMMSASNFDAKDILEKGAIGFLSKPVSEENIEKTFSNIILNIDNEVKKVLLVEDQEVLSDFIKNTFAEHHINIMQAFTLESALIKLETEDNIDCVILDLSLPDGSGLDLLERLKSDDKLKHIPVIINTAKELTPEQTEKIARHTKSMVFKDGKSTNRLIDEVNLFLSKINNHDYKPLRNADKLDQQEYFGKNILKDKKVLIVDDDMRNVFALTTSLQEQEMNIEIANNGREALELLQSEDSSFDIILMDIMMPEMDGYEAIEQIRKDKRHTKLPIIAVTAKAMKGDREKSIQLGANDYISKPIDMDKLLSLMQVWLS